MLTAITGNKRHQMEYASESYGGMKKSKPRQQPKNEGNGLVKTASIYKETVAVPSPRALWPPGAKSQLDVEVVLLAAFSLLSVWNCQSSLMHPKDHQPSIRYQE
jgi:hypothetical protein